MRDKGKKGGKGLDELQVATESEIPELQGKE